MEILIAGNTVAGLSLVFLGAIANSYRGYSADEQASVRDQYQRRAWLAFAGFALALLAAVCALLQDWIRCEWTWLETIARLFLSSSLIAVFLAALITARSID